MRTRQQVEDAEPWRGLWSSIPKLARPQVWRLIAPTHCRETPPPPDAARYQMRQRARSASLRRRLGVVPVLHIR